MKTVIMAGGLGTRIKELFPDIPKPLIKIGDRTILELELLSLKEQGFNEIILTLSHMADKIIDYFGNGERLGINIDYFVEREPLGNAGALFKIPQLEGDFLLLNADSLFDIDFNRFLAFHREHQALVSLLTHPNSHPYDSGLILADDRNCVTGWLNKEDPRPLYYKNRVNAGLHILNSKVLSLCKVDRDAIGQRREGGTVKVDLDRDVLKPLCNSGLMFAYDSPEYVKDMGTPERFSQVLSDYTHGLVARKKLTKKQRAIFLDRDGTINKYVGFLRDLDEFELLPGVSEAIKIINSLGYLAIVVTNQPVVARGEVSIEKLEQIHQKMETLLGKDGAYLDAIYYCPHHKDKGFEGEIVALKIDCDCRKPKPGMLLKAARDFNIDLEQSWMVGDSMTDIEAGCAASCHTALVGHENYGQEKTYTSLLEFAQHLT